MIIIDSDHKQDSGLKQFFKRLKFHWKLFTFCMLGFIALGYLFTVIVTPQYLISSAVLIQGQPTPTNPSSVYAAGVNSVLNSNDNLKNEGDVLRTRNLMKETVSALHLNVRMFNGSGIFSKEINDEAPIKISINHYRVDTLRKRDFTIEILNKYSAHVTNSEDLLDTVIKLNQPIRLSQYDLLIAKKPLAKLVPATYTARIVSEDDITSELLKNYDAEFSDKTTSTIDITLYYPNSKKGEVIVQHLMNQYLNDNAANKKKLMDDMLTFLNGRISGINTELVNIEKAFETFRSSNSIADLDEQSKALIGNASNYYNQFQTQQIQLSIINNLINYLKDPNNKQTIPGSLSIQDASFITSLNDYNTLIQTREKKLLSFTATNPLVTNIDQQIKIARENLLQNVESYKNEMELRSAQLGDQKSTINNFLKGVPEKQRALLDFGRQQDLKQQLYMYLLQKREETALAKTSQVPTSRVIDPAKSTKDPAKPLKPLVYLLAVLLGFIVPFGYTNLRPIPHVTIKSEQDIQNQTSISIIGKIGHSVAKGNLLIKNGDETMLTESFRTLRAKVQNIFNTDEPKIIMVTSSINGEGKTFVSSNLASVLAKTQKKVLLMELDLRKPKLSPLFGYDSDSTGFSNYILGNASLADILKKTDFNENLSIISSGPVVANASELLLSKKAKELFTSLKEKFDYIIIDSSPVGLVSDALIIEKYADMTIYICRHNYTNTQQISMVNQLKAKDNIDNMYLVVNDVDFAKAGYVSYGYGIGYGEGRNRR